MPPTYRQTITRLSGLAIDRDTTIPSDIIGIISDFKTRIDRLDRNIKEMESVMDSSQLCVLIKSRLFDLNEKFTNLYVLRLQFEY